MYLSFMTFSVCPLRTFHKKLGHPKCLGLILADVFWIKSSFPHSKFPISLDFQKNADFSNNYENYSFSCRGLCFWILSLDIQIKINV